ncbi:MAG: Rrf2 family transcriptional regulator [Planctomycetes bacterium]|nr:Rrf2 family transcriptional regulator [Planctomycetota bacterium]
MFSQASEYALRALTELARCEQGQWVLAGDMAELLDVPVHYLAKVLQTLARKGVLESQRGRQGGFRLADAPHQITVYDVVRELDDLRSMESCIMGEADCSDETACPLHNLWAGIRDRFTESLQMTTLLDLARFQEQRPGSGRLSAVKSKLPAMPNPPRTKLDKKV